MSNLWRKISSMGQNDSSRKSEDKQPAAQPGDRVIHRASGGHGVVTAVETIGNVLTLSVECDDGRILRGLDRKEFVFDGDAAYTPPVAPAPKAAASAPATEPMPKMEGEISSEAILEKLS